MIHLHPCRVTDSPWKISLIIIKHIEFGFFSSYHSIKLKSKDNYTFIFTLANIFLEYEPPEVQKHLFLANG